MPLPTSIVKELKVEHEDGAYSYPAPSDLEPGVTVTRPDGSLAVLDGLDGVKAGEIITPRPLECEKTMVGVAASATTWAAAAEVYWDDSANVVTNVSTGNTKLGRSIDAKTAGMTRVHFVATQR